MLNTNVHVGPIEPKWHVIMRRRGSVGFTLIELLVVVAIIALLISILLPSLNKARAQARTTICLSRIGQLGKAFLVYSEDFEGVFPFTSTLQETSAQGPNTIETWLANWAAQADPCAAISRVAHRSEADWGVMRALVPRSGTLFTYARFENLYRCPEFERQQEAEQHVFNYTRPLFGRLWRLPQEYEAGGQASPKSWGGVDGPILRITQIHNPGQLPLTIDEQWNRFVGAWTLDDGMKNSAYNCADYGFYTENVVAVSHGPRIKSSMHPFDDGSLSWGATRARPALEPCLWPSGGVVYYDGHAQLFRDPWPTLTLGKNKRTGVWRDQADTIFRRHDEEYGLFEYALYVIYAQRGFNTKTRYGNPPAIW
jgi:prepilin-type N-terminal cleavage/methylation domain-containing protein